MRTRNGPGPSITRSDHRRARSSEMRAPVARKSSTPSAMSKFGFGPGATGGFSACCRTADTSWAATSSRSMISTGFFSGRGSGATPVTGFPETRPRPVAHCMILERTERFWCAFARRLGPVTIPCRYSAQTCRSTSPIGRCPSAGIRSLRAILAYSFTVVTRHRDRSEEAYSIHPSAISPNCVSDPSGFFPLSFSSWKCFSRAFSALGGGTVAGPADQLPVVVLEPPGRAVPAVRLLLAVADPPPGTHLDLVVGHQAALPTCSCSPSQAAS